VRSLRAGDFFCAKKEFIMTNATVYWSSAEIEIVVRKLENCEYGVHEFGHDKHLAVAAWYLTSPGPRAALERMRASLLRFTEHHGKTGYHETITRFWLLLVEDFLRTEVGASSLADKVNRLVCRYADKNIVFDYYSCERIMSEEARSTWVEPDLRKLGDPQPVSR
jgi:hypothetical protein